MEVLCNMVLANLSPMASQGSSVKRGKTHSPLRAWTLKENQIQMKRVLTLPPHESEKVPEKKARRKKTESPTHSYKHSLTHTNTHDPKARVTNTDRHTHTHDARVTNIPPIEVQCFNNWNLQLRELKGLLEYPPEIRSKGGKYATDKLYCEHEHE